MNSSMGSNPLIQWNGSGSARIASLFTSSFTLINRFTSAIRR